MHVVCHDLIFNIASARCCCCRGRVRRTGTSFTEKLHNERLQYDDNGDGFGGDIEDEDDDEDDTNGGADDGNFSTSGI